MDKLISMLLQPSTIRGIVSVLVGIGVLNITPEVQDAIVQVSLQLLAAGITIGGIINVVRNENKQKVTNEIKQEADKPQPTADTTNQLRDGKF